MPTLISVIATLMLVGGLWAFTQSQAGTQWPIPTAVGGFVILVMVWMK